MKSKKRVLTLLTIIVVFLISNTSYITFNCNNGNHLKPQKKDQIQIKRSGTWNLTGSPILIDDLDVNLNWSKTALENDWCSGSGTWDNPYKIENVTIDGQSLNSCIEIKNSNVYFIIQNCIVYNSGPSDESGLYLFNVNNSRIINSTCSNNNNYNFGIRLSSSNNITIFGNVANNNYHGILLENS
ncbi:unnamed protein product, partial [marine sediment metagenome]